MGSGESGPMDLGGAKRSRSPSAASPLAFWLISPVLPANPSAAGSPGRGGARERPQFSPSGGNGDKRPQGELARRAKRRWPGPLRRRAAAGKVTRRRSGEISPRKRYRKGGAPSRRALQDIRTLTPHPPPSGVPFPRGGRLKKSRRRPPKKFCLDYQNSLDKRRLL